MQVWKFVDRALLAFILCNSVASFVAGVTIYRHDPNSLLTCLTLGVVSAFAAGVYALVLKSLKVI